MINRIEIETYSQFYNPWLFACRPYPSSSLTHILCFGVCVWRFENIPKTSKHTSMFSKFLFFFFFQIHFQNNRIICRVLIPFLFTNRNYFQAAAICFEKIISFSEFVWPFTEWPNNFGLKLLPNPLKIKKKKLK